MPPAPRNRKFDLERFQQMIEPFTVRVERLEGSTRSPIPLPPSPSTGMTSPCTAPVTGWTAGDVSGLEQWLLTEWSGGGFYSISIVDANNTSMEWEANFDPGKYPKMVPPPLRSGANPMITSTPREAPPTSAAAQMLPQLQASAESYGAGPGFYPAHVYGPTTYGPTTYAPTTNIPQGTPMYRPTWFPPPPIVQAPPANGHRDRERELETESKAHKAALDEALRTIERMRYDAEIQRRDMEARAEKLLRDIEGKYQGQISDLRGGFDKQVSNLEREVHEMRRAAERPPVDIDAKLETMFERMVKPLLGNKDDERVKRLEDELRRERDERATQERERQLREELRRMEERTQGMMRELKDAQKDRGPDPILQMMQTSMQTQMEALRQVSQQQQLSMQQLTQFMMPPQAIAGIMRDASNGSDQLMKNVMGAFSSMFDLFRDGVANVLQLSGSGESPMMRVIENGLEKLGGLGDNWVKGQRDAQVAQAKVQQTYIEAQAEMARAQAQAQQSAAQAQQPVPQQQWANQQPGQPQPQITGPGKTQPQPETDEPKVRGLTDVQWFGGAHERVVELRKAVAQYADATKARPFKRNEEGQIVGAAPKDTARFVMEAARFIVANNVNLDTVPAFRLFMQERYADLLDLLLPEASQAYRDDVVKCLTSVLEPTVSEDEDEEGEDEEDDEEENEAEEAASPAAAPAPSSTPPAASPARPAAPNGPASKPAARPGVATRRPVA